MDLRLVASLNKEVSKTPTKSSKNWVRESYTVLSGLLKPEHNINYTTIDDWKNDFEYIAPDLKAFNIFAKSTHLVEGEFYHTETFDMNSEYENLRLQQCLIKLLGVKPDLDNDLIQYEIELHSTSNEKLLGSDLINLGDNFVIYQPFLVDPDSGDCETILKEVNTQKMMHIAQKGSVSKEIMDHFGISKDFILKTLKEKSTGFSDGVVLGLFGAFVFAKFLNKIQKSLEENTTKNLIEESSK
jgi:hypothetical protein